MSSSKMLNGDVAGREPSSVTNKGQFKNKLKVLVVDDCEFQRFFFTSLLKYLGVETKVAESGKEAVELFVEGAKYDLILMDHDMPIMDGPQTTRMLRSMGVLDKIVGVSSRSSSDEINEFIHAGLNACVTNSINLEKLAPLLREADNQF